jgi:hypothetical protein
MDSDACSLECTIYFMPFEAEIFKVHNMKDMVHIVTLISLSKFSSLSTTRKKILSKKVVKSTAFQRSKVLHSCSDMYPISYYEDFSMNGMTQITHSRKHVRVNPHKHFIGSSSCSIVSFAKKKKRRRSTLLGFISRGL